MIRGSLAFYIERLLDERENGCNIKSSLAMIKAICRKEFNGIMPTYLFIFPKVAKIYVMSKTLCFEYPNSGSWTYRLKLEELYEFLQDYFIVGKSFFDGKIVYQVKGVKYG